MPHIRAENQNQHDLRPESTKPGRSLTAGTILEGRYQIQKVIGRGGMSTVYAARDLRFSQVDRITAIKEMVDEEPDPGTRALRLVNFERESALLATITHSAVPKIYDYFSQDGLVYLVLEYIDGSDLERGLISRNRPYPESDVLQWTLEIAGVLKMLHNFKPDPIIFRDLKPSNIMLRANGQIALVDFGIARMFQGRQRGTMIGTEGYAPPEQYRGITDVRGDIYAFGATLHHLITNSDPRQEAPFTFHERPVNTLNPDVNRGLAQMIAKMVEYHPDQRQQSIDEIIQTTESILNHGRYSASTSGNQPSTSPVETSFEGDVLDDSGELDRNQQTTVFTGPVNTPAARQDGFQRRRSSRKRRHKRVDKRSDGRVAWQVSTTDEVRGTALWDGQQLVIGSYDRHLYAINPDLATTNWKFPSGSGIVARPVRSENLIIVGSEDGSIYGIDVSTGALNWSCRTGRPVRSSAVVADDTVYVGSDDSSAYALESMSGEIRWRSRLWGPVRSSPVISGDTIIVGSDDGNLYCIDRSDGETVWREPCGGPVRSIPVVRGDRVFVTSWYGSCSCFDASNGRRIWHHGFETVVASSPSVAGESVIVGVTDGAIVALDADSGKKRWAARYANQITATALIGENLLYTGTIDGDCLAIALPDGEMAWRHSIGGPIVSSPVFTGEHIVVGSIDGNVYGIALDDSEIAELSASHNEQR